MLIYHLHASCALRCICADVPVDINGDGYIDVMLDSNAENPAKLMVNRGDGSFTSQPWLFDTDVSYYHSSTWRCWLFVDVDFIPKAVLGGSGDAVTSGAIASN